MSLCRNHDDQRMSFILFVLTEEHLLNVSPHSRQVAHMHSAWRSLIHVILWQNVSCLGRTQCASIPIQFRDRRRSLSCTTGPWSLWGLVEQMVSFSTSIWPSSPFFFLLFFSFPKGAPGGKCLRKMAVTPRRCLIHFSQDMLFKSICSRGGVGGSCALMHRLLMPEYIPDHQGWAWTPFFLTSTQMEGIFSHRSQCCFQSAR